MEAARCFARRRPEAPRRGPRWQLRWPLHRVAVSEPPELHLPDHGTPAILVGRDRDCDVVLADLAVSRHHAALVLYAGRWFVLDRGSTNGTWVNGRRIWGATSIRAGDRLQVGRTAFRLAR
jgi:pSer/pThr/pTyr-binding forkhead associated (FHA) protein